MPLRVVDLFSGAGGLSLGFHAAGCLIDAAVDVDSVASKTFRQNFTVLQADQPPRVFSGEQYDLECVSFHDLTDSPPDILIGGPPCQGYSRLGRAKLDSLSDQGFEADPRNQLYRKFLDAVQFWQPLAVVMENVPGMLSVRGTNYADLVMEELAEQGYRVGYAHLNAVWYGVPQLRERLFFVGVRRDLNVQPMAPQVTHHMQLPDGYRRPLLDQMRPLPFDTATMLSEGELAVSFSAKLIPAVTVSQALADLPSLTGHLSDAAASPTESRKPLAYRSEPHSSYARLMRSWTGFPESRAVLDHASRRTPRDYETFRRMKPGDRYPEAIEIARQRFEEEIDRLKKCHRAPKVGSPEWEELEASIIPPYPESIFEDKWRKLIPEQPSWTIPAHLAKDSYSHIHYDSDQARAISIREAARLQSFPDGFRFSGNMGDCFRQIGNAVPPLVGWHIAHALLGLLDSKAVEPPLRDSTLKDH